jgi:acyl-CoA thioesterase-1
VRGWSEHRMQSSGIGRSVSAPILISDFCVVTSGIPLTPTLSPSGGEGVFRLLAFSLIIWLTIASSAFAAPIKILMLGTSLTQGFGLPPGAEIPALLEKKLNETGIDAKVINAGVSGDTSAGGLARLDWSLADHPDAAIVELGSNDALRGIPPGQTERNLSTILAKLKAQKIPTLLLGMMAPRNLGREYAKQFDAIYPKLAKQYGAMLYPFLLQGVALNPKLNQPDGMHPNPSGAKIVADRIFPDVKKLVSQAASTKRAGARPY